MLYFVSTITSIFSKSYVYKFLLFHPLLLLTSTGVMFVLALLQSVWNISKLTYFVRTWLMVSFYELFILSSKPLLTFFFYNIFLKYFRVTESKDLLIIKNQMHTFFSATIFLSVNCFNLNNTSIVPLLLTNHFGAFPTFAINCFTFP